MLRLNGGLNLTSEAQQGRCSYWFTKIAGLVASESG